LTGSSKIKRPRVKRIKTRRKKPFNTFHWFVLGVVFGIGLGIITGLIVATINIVTNEWPNGPPSWGIIKWVLSMGATIYGMGGAVVGGFVGFIIGVVRSPRQ
jgi:hypothetical protein